MRLAARVGNCVQLASTVGTAFRNRDQQLAAVRKPNGLAEILASRVQQTRRSIVRRNGVKALLIVWLVKQIHDGLPVGRPRGPYQSACFGAAGFSSESTFAATVSTGYEEMHLPIFGMTPQEGEAFAIGRKTGRAVNVTCQLQGRSAENGNFVQVAEEGIFLAGTDIVDVVGVRRKR